MAETRAEAISPVRGKTHGDFASNAQIAVPARTAMRATKGWTMLTMAQQLTLDEIQLKIARILSGAADFKEHWDDIAGYANLGGRDAE